MNYVNGSDLIYFKLLVGLKMAKYPKMRLVNTAIELDISPSHLKNILNNKVKLTTRIYDRACLNSIEK